MTPPGFSAEAWEAVQRKPCARIIDATAENRYLWGKDKFRDSVIFTDREPSLYYKPDLVSTWMDLPNHFPRDYFHCIIFDPPHIFSETNRFNRNPSILSNGSKGVPGWYGAFKNRRDAVNQIIKAQKAFTYLGPRLCFKWNEASMSIDSVLSLFTEWKIQFGPQRWVAVDRPKRKTAWTWWVKLVRR